MHGIIVQVKSATNTEFPWMFYMQWSNSIPVRRHPLMYLSCVQMVWKSGRFTGFPCQHCWIRPDNKFGQFGGSCGLFPLRTLPLNALTDLNTSVGGKGVGSPISTQKQISPKL
jgi:hypothetical protein